MTSRCSRSLLALTALTSLTAAACGSDGGDAADTTETTVPPTAAGTDAAAGVVDLAGICPDTVRIITDWNPEAEHGFLYQMVGPDYSIDDETGSVSGTLIGPGGVDTGVAIEVMSGGPLIGYQSVTSQLYTNDDILLGFVYTDGAIQNSAEFPTVAIESGFEKNPQMIMWDPETYPDVKTIADLGKTDAFVRYSGGAPYMEYFTGEGILRRDQVDASYDGTPALFVAEEGKSAQQGFGSAEPYLYEKVIEEWMKPVEYQYINDAGWNNYAESIATRPENIEKYGDCFAELVPIIQQSSIDYLRDPARANSIILAAVEEFDTGWVYDQGVADYAVETILADGLVSDGPDGIVGNFDMERVNDLIAKSTPVFTRLDQPPKEGLVAEDIVTNQFIDDSISLGS